MNTRAKLLITFVALLLGMASVMPSAEAQNLLVDPDFNGTPPLSTIANVLGPPFVTGLWGPENGAIVGVDGGVTPLSSPTMLAEYAPGTGSYTQTAQATDVSSYPAGTTFTLSAEFDANQALPAADAAVNISFYDAAYNLLASPPSVGLILDNNPSTWQPISVTATEPLNTKYVLSQVLYDNSTLQTGGVSFPSYVDNASLTAPEPSTFALLAAGAVGLAGFVWRRRWHSRKAVPAARRLRVAAVVACAALWLSAAQLSAGVILPPGPPPVYEIAFVTTDGTSAISPNIGTYNTFVTNEANQDATLSGLGVSWNAIVSTSSVNANANALSSAGIPVYNTQGQLVTNAGLYSGGVLSDPIWYDQFGNSNTLSAWTGSTVLGNADPIYYMDSSSGTTEMGNPFSTTTTWLAGFPAGQVNVNGLLQPAAIYALSSPITTPEPATTTLLGTALLGFGGTWLVRRRRAQR